MVEEGRSVVARGGEAVGALVIGETATQAPVRAACLTDGLGSASRTAIDPVAEIGRNADLATEMARRAAARGRLNGTPQHFGDYAHIRFEQLNERLNRRLLAEGSSFRVEPEVFRDAAGYETSRGAAGSIGADVVLTSVNDAAYIEIFDLKTHGGVMRLISQSRQDEFLSRFGARAQEIFRQR
jgi:hypothetical protein